MSIVITYILRTDRGHNSQLQVKHMSNGITYSLKVDRGHTTISNCVKHMPNGITYSLEVSRGHTTISSRLSTCQIKSLTS
jgi:hypothetical protein